MSAVPEAGSQGLRIAYLCLQATTEGQASYAHVREIINGLRELGHEVVLYQPGYAGGKAPGPLGRLIEFARVQRALAAHLREHDVLYVRAHALALPASMAARRRGVPVVQECNGPFSDFVEAWPAARPLAGVLAAMSRRQYRAAQTVVAVTPELGEWVSRETGQTTVEVVTNGANVDLFVPGLPKPDALPERYVVFFGALQPWQGVPVILEAVLQPLWPEVLPVVFVGSGRAEHEILACQAEYPELITYLGKVPYRAVPAIVANSVASLVVCSREQRESSGVSPLKLYESMACGVPIIAGDLPGLGDAVREADCGLVVDPASPVDVAGAVARLAADEELSQAMGRRGRSAAAESYSWRAKAGQIDRLLRRVV